ncbi:MAG: hypothetical protein JWL59_4838 [Chthoniobacteraceae bacterium]|nr:hypothetical protein [Chthoniobacteraceae bacterium]
MGVEEHLQERVHVSALDLELLGHGHANDFAAVDIGEVERVRTRAKDSDDVRGDECLEIVGDGFFYAADLLGRLVEKSVPEMSHHLVARGAGIGVDEVVECVL